MAALDRLGFPVRVSSFVPEGMVILVRDQATLDRFIWTANALADQELEILRLRAQRDDLQERNTELVLQRRAIAEELERLRGAPYVPFTPPHGDGG